jgi:phosphate transport system substrate-binding protein
MTYVVMQNASGNWVSPDDVTFKAAANGANWDKTYYQVLTEQADKNAWPISGATFILVHLKPEKPENVKIALKFFDWAFTKGDTTASDLDYVPLPDSVKTKIRNDWKKLNLN